MAADENMGNEKPFEGKISDFWTLTGECRVVIPIIQRDYAQGRENDDVRQIRDKFVRQLFDCLEKNQGQELDFVYGSLEQPKDIMNDKPDSSIFDFTPLDGQQRLTTLFLLHWFIAIWNNEDYEVLKLHLNNRFGYRTRASSRDFCEKLIMNCQPERIIKIINSSEKNPVSRSLMNEGWFHDAWINDPTIKGMLVMLDSMSKNFIAGDKKEKAHSYFKKLVPDNQGLGLVTFNLLYLNRGKVQISDELYIKMNSRGKPLTDFETFKAKFETFLRKYTEIDANKFCQDIDHEWADIFWSIKDDATPTTTTAGKSAAPRDNTDGMMMNLIKATLANSYSLLTEDPDYSTMEVLFETDAAIKQKLDLRLTYYRCSAELGVINENLPAEDDEEHSEKRLELIKWNKKIGKDINETFQVVCDIISSSNQPEYQIFAVAREYLDTKECLYKILFYKCDGEASRYKVLSYADRLMFYCYSQYCIRFKKEIKTRTDKRHPDKCLGRWMRFVRNMCESREFDRAGDMQKALHTFDNLLTEIGGYSRDIISYLNSLREYPSLLPFPATQSREETLKARLIERDSRWETEIIAADNNTDWPGRSGYLLYFVGLADKNKDYISNMPDVDISRYIDSFRSYRSRMEALIYAYHHNDRFPSEFLIQRALLSKGNYMRKESGGVFSMMDRSLSGRSYSFRQMIQYNGIPDETGSESRKDQDVYDAGVNILKEVLDDSQLCFSPVSGENDITHYEVTSESVLVVIANPCGPMDDWRIPMINERRLWDRELCEQRFFWNDGNRGRIPHRQNGNSGRYETWTYWMYLTLKDSFAKHNKKRIEKLKPELAIDFRYAKNEEPDGIRLDFKIKEALYRLKVWRDAKSKEWVFTIVKVVFDNDWPKESNLDPEDYPIAAEALRIRQGCEKKLCDMNKAAYFALLVMVNIDYMKSKYAALQMMNQDSSQEI